MKGKKVLGLLVSLALALGCLLMPATATVVPGSETYSVTATGKFEATISAGMVRVVSESFSLDSGETVTYNCTYTPRNASVMFGYIAPDGYFYGLSGSNGSINKGIQVSEPGSYTLAIWNQSGEAVTVKGTVNY